MTKQDIVTKLTDKLGIHPNQIKLIIDSFMSEVKDSLETGESVFLRGFGTYSVVTRKKKKAQNIRTKTTITMPSTKVPTFKAVKSFKDRIKNS